MFTEIDDNRLDAVDVDLAREGGSSIDDLLSSLSDGQLAERIMDAARLAMARHIFEVAGEYQSAVEAENSTK